MRTILAVATLILLSSCSKRLSNVYSEQVLECGDIDSCYRWVPVKFAKNNGTPPSTALQAFLYPSFRPLPISSKSWIGLDGKISKEEDLVLRFERLGAVYETIFRSGNTPSDLIFRSFYERFFSLTNSLDQSTSCRKHFRP
jgi:hypothetical protein